MKQIEMNIEQELGEIKITPEKEEQKLDKRDISDK